MPRGKLVPRLLLVGLWGLFLLTSCTRVFDPVENPMENEAINYQPSIEEAKPYSVTIFDMTLKLAANALTDYERLKSESQPSFSVSTPFGVANTDSQSYEFVDGFHIWRGVLEFDRFKDTLYIAFERKIQFRSRIDGAVLVNSDGADYMYQFFRVYGHFGFVNGEKYGEKFDHLIEGEWAGLVDGVPTLNATGKYEDIWSGIYNGQDVVFHYLVNIAATDLQFIFESAEVGYRLAGDVQLTMEPFEVYAKMDGSPMAQIDVYKAGEKVTSFQFRIPNLYGWDIISSFPGVSQSIRSLEIYRPLTGILEN
ncbi:MAG: hypothetical protein GXO78_10890 [Calditrichaeota bacterium]|nr:hypothetical protein [Calditrichota bacterium]